MSTLQNRSQVPQVYNYGGNNVRTSYNVQSSPLNVPREQNAFKISQVQPVVINHNDPKKSNPFIQNPTNERPSSNKNEKRYTEYSKHQYKYNLYSIIDEPWNRCVQTRKCGGCSGNQCISRQVRRSQWNWV